VIVCFVDIGGIVEVRGYCLFLLILVELLRWEAIPSISIK
jgi:hypothetical protein